MQLMVRQSVLAQVSSQEFTAHALQVQRQIHGSFVSTKRFLTFPSRIRSADPTEIMLLTVTSTKMKRMFAQTVTGRNTLPLSPHLLQMRMLKHILQQLMVLLSVQTLSSPSAITLNAQRRVALNTLQSPAVQSVMMLLLNVQTSMV